jgi:hypothetical protein
MKTIHIILIAVIFSLLGNCKKDPSKSAVVSMHVDIAYNDKLGNDLLDPTRQNHFSSDSIHVFNVVNGIKKEVYYPNYDAPHNFVIYKNDSLKSYYLKLFLETDTTLLVLNKTITDTVTCTSENWILIKAWYNGVFECDGGYQTFTIIK